MTRPPFWSYSGSKWGHRPKTGIVTKNQSRYESKSLCQFWSNRCEIESTWTPGPWVQVDLISDLSDENWPSDFDPLWLIYDATNVETRVTFNHLCFSPGAFPLQPRTLACPFNLCASWFCLLSLAWVFHLLLFALNPPNKISWRAFNRRLCAPMAPSKLFSWRTIRCSRSCWWLLLAAVKPAPVNSEKCNYPISC